MDLQSHRPQGGNPDEMPANTQVQAGVSRYLAVAQGLYSSSEAAKAASDAAHRAAELAMPRLDTSSIIDIGKKRPSSARLALSKSTTGLLSSNESQHAAVASGSMSVRSRPSSAVPSRSMKGSQAVGLKSSRSKVRLGRLRDALNFADTDDAPAEQIAVSTESNAGETGPGFSEAQGPKLQAAGVKSKPKWGLGRPLSARRK